MIDEIAGAGPGRLDTSSSVANSYQYDAFGVGRSASEAFSNPFRFAGRALDADSTLHHFLARQYDAVQGRFLSSDPIRHEDAGPNYAYVSGRPTVRVDPTGLWDDKKIHKKKTREWAKAEGMKKRYAKQAGEGCRDIDVEHGSLNPEDQDWHFDIVTDDTLTWDHRDSRYRHYEERFNEAVRLANMECPEYDAAAYALGEALHPQQDWYAHGNWAPGATGHPGITIHPRGFDDPTKDFYCDWYPGPCNSRTDKVFDVPVSAQVNILNKPVWRQCFRAGARRISATEEATKSTIQAFRDRLSEEARKAMFDE